MVQLEKSGDVVVVVYGDHHELAQLLGHCTRVLQTRVETVRELSLHGGDNFSPSALFIPCMAKQQGNRRQSDSSNRLKVLMIACWQQLKRESSSGMDTLLVTTDWHRPSCKKLYAEAVNEEGRITDGKTIITQWTGMRPQDTLRLAEDQKSGEPKSEDHQEQCPYHSPIDYGICERWEMVKQTTETFQSVSDSSARQAGKHTCT